MPSPKRSRRNYRGILTVGAPLSFVTYWELSRETENNKDSFKVRGSHTVILDKAAREALANCLNATKSTVARILVAKVLPKFLKVSNLATAYIIDTLMVRDERSVYSPYGAAASG